MVNDAIKTKRQLRWVEIGTVAGPSSVRQWVLSGGPNTVASHARHVQATLAVRWPTGEMGQGASPSAASSVDLAALLRQRPDRGNMADVKELADQAAVELLTAIRDQARTATDLKLLQLAQAYSMVVSTEVSTRLADEGATAMAESVAEYESGVLASISPEYPKGV